jgi:hypothetical protein
MVDVTLRGVPLPISGKWRKLSIVAFFFQASYSLFYKFFRLRTDVSGVDQQRGTRNCPRVSMFRTQDRFADSTIPQGMLRTGCEQRSCVSEIPVLPIEQGIKNALISTLYLVMLILMHHLTLNLLQFHNFGSSIFVATRFGDSPTPISFNQINQVITNVSKLSKFIG